MRTHFRHEIEGIREMVRSLAGDVERNAAQGLEAFFAGDAGRADRAALADNRVDFREVRIEEECLKVIALHQPVADDLRFLAVMLKVNHELERISDLAVDIAGAGRSVTPDALVPYETDLRAAAEAVQAMLSRAMSALLDVDAAAAKAVWLSDRDVDSRCGALAARLQADLPGRGADAPPLFRALEAVGALERMADHAAGIAKSVIYMTTGEVVRHRGREFRRAAGGQKTRVLFVCVHNSARSRMAEAWLNHLHGNRYEAESAGLTPGAVNPIAARVMAEAGLDIATRPPRTVEQAVASSKPFDYVITVCDQAGAESCPPVFGIAEQIQWEFEDPAGFQGTEEEVTDQVRRLREAIRARINRWVSATAV